MTAATLRMRAGHATDAELATLVADGNDAAFAVLHARYERRLVADARRILGGRAAVAEDVVQEAFLRAHRALRRGGEIEHVRAWLYRLVRNCALDELTRTRHDTVPLHDVPPDGEPAAPGADPDAVLDGRLRIRSTLEDVAALPELQRQALLRREVDGLGHEDLARELGTSVAAAKSLVFRARENLTKAARARDARCRDVRDELLRAHDRRRRASAHAYRHLATCRDCRVFRQSLGMVRDALHLVSPLPAVLAVAAGLKAALAGSGAGTKVASAAAALVAGGAVGIEQVVRAGQPSPVTVRSAVVPGGALAKGAAVPRGVAIVRRTVIAPDRPRRTPSTVTLTCPAGMRVAGLVPATGAPALAYAPETVIGASTTARVLLAGGRPRQRITVATLCKRPDPSGSVLARPERTATAAATTTPPPVRVCVRHAYLHTLPGAGVTGSVRLAQPVRVLRTSPAGWLRVRSDAGATGWVRPDAFC